MCDAREEEEEDEDETDESEVRVEVLDAEADEALDPLDEVRAIAAEPCSSSDPSAEGDDTRLRLRGEVRWKNERRSPFGADGGFVGVLRSRKTLLPALELLLGSSSCVVGGVDRPSSDELAPDVISTRTGAGDENVSLTASLQSELGATG